MRLDEPTSRRLQLPIEPGRSGVDPDLGRVFEALTAPADPERQRALVDSGRLGTVLWQPTAETGLVVAVDGLRPPLPDPTTSGEVTAVHALANIAAAGGEPLLGLVQAALPTDLPGAALASLVRGAGRALTRAGAVLGGGHAVRATAPFIGLAVVGRVDPARRLRPDAARPGDRLVLTKPLGTGLVLAGQGRRGMRESWLEIAVEVMTRLDGPAVEVARRHRVEGCVHVGGCGLLGAGAAMARAAGCRVVLDARELPTLPGAYELAAAGVEDEGAGRIREAVAPLLTLDLRLDPLLVAVAADPQMAGGLLLAVPPVRLEPVLRDLAGAGSRSWVIGRVEAAIRPEVVLA